jgi:hypothetical protein
MGKGKGNGKAELLGLLFTSIALAGMPRVIKASTTGCNVFVLPFQLELGYFPELLAQKD